MCKVLSPLKIKKVNGKVIFLAGPIHGSISWQDKATHYIHSKNNNIFIANPRSINFDNESFELEKQIDWETYYLNRAAENGAIIFWLAKERKHICEKPYAQTSRFELGEWKIKYEQNNINLVIGIENGFSNERYIKHRFNIDCPKINIHNDLICACDDALKLCSK